MDESSLDVPVLISVPAGWSLGEFREVKPLHDYGLEDDLDEVLEELDVEGDFICGCGSCCFFGGESSNECSTIPFSRSPLVLGPILNPHEKLVEPLRDIALVRFVDFVYDGAERSPPHPESADVEHEELVGASGIELEVVDV